MRLNHNIRLLRNQAGLTQRELAKHLGIKRETLCFYENGIRNIPKLFIEKIANFFLVDAYDLLNLEGYELTSQIKITSAFKTLDLTKSDTKIVEGFKKIVMNYLKMEKALAKS